METTQETAIEPPCVNCKKLIKADRHTKPHDDLISIGSKPITSMYGSADEYYYECRKCRKSWLHETGSHGEGWIE